MSKHLEYREAFGLLTGHKLSEGSSRKVYICRIDPSLVVKKEMKRNSFQNIVEWEVWTSAWDKKLLSKWFAPCMHISGCGTLLVQARTFPIKSSDLPKKIPEFMTDTKIQNWGWYQDRPVCHDYGTMVVGFLQKKHQLVKAEWWNEETDYLK